jgi:hypothetical protein
MELTGDDKGQPDDNGKSNDTKIPIIQVESVALWFLHESSVEDTTKVIEELGNFLVFSSMTDELIMLTVRKEAARIEQSSMQPGMRGEQNVAQMSEEELENANKKKAKFAADKKKKIAERQAEIDRHVKTITNALSGEGRSRWFSNLSPPELKDILISKMRDTCNVQTTLAEGGFDEIQKCYGSNKVLNDDVINKLVDEALTDHAKQSQNFQKEFTVQAANRYFKQYKLAPKKQQLFIAFVKSQPTYTDIYAALSGNLKDDDSVRFTQEDLKTVLDAFSVRKGGFTTRKKRKTKQKRKTKGGKKHGKNKTKKQRKNKKNTKTRRRK